MNNAFTNHSTHLIVGPHDETRAYIIKSLQQLWCAHNGCSTCGVCASVVAQQHHALFWLTPNPQYTLEQIDLLIEKTAFTLEPYNYFFCIIEKADFLTLASANRLLKTLEEPPRGYHFILQAPRIESILPTIASRCLITPIYSTKSVLVSHPIAVVFINLQFAHPDIFLKLIDDHELTDRETTELIDQLLHYWLVQTIHDQGENCAKTKSHIMSQLLKEALNNPPMPGSSKLFWKNLFLKTQQHLSHARS
ncbi:MAG: DNA polymerase III subunit delta' [Candidatus Dependentiae bacterium ADurb.Bin331]|nr:MAG: DNA polymerase III subunit delta' [Candidatus Dependentiae bacterium ADurb.Bin331]